MTNVLSVASEVYPLIKTGGLADVAGALPAALRAERVAMRTIIPGYSSVMPALQHVETVCGFDDLFGGPAWLLAARAAGLELFVVNAPHLYTRPGGPYGDASGREWPDNAQRFAALSQMAARIGQGLVDNFLPDVVHAHDWQAGLTPAYLQYREGRRPGTVVTVHNLAFQGQFPASLLGQLGLPPHSYSVDGVEYYGSIGFLKAGLRLADRITTVSPSYAAEIQTPEGGMGLDGLLRDRSMVLSGILNGIDEAVWNPANDPLIPASFAADRLKGRRETRLALQERFGLRTDPSSLILGVVSRLTWQKGMDLLADIAATLPDPVQLAVLGSGDPRLEAAFEDAAAQKPGQIGTVIGYDEAVAHLIQAGTDALLVPSRFEPCGLTQLCALRYGSLPIVSRVGGLADSVIDANDIALASGVATGFQFSPVTADGLNGAIGRALRVWGQGKAWRRMQRNAMEAPVGWARAASLYAQLYRSVTPQA